MEVKLVLQDIIFRELFDCNQAEKTVQFNGGTVADLFKEIKTTKGTTFYDEVVGLNGSKPMGCKIWYNFMAFLDENTLDKPLKSGDKIILMMSIPGGGC